jgi:hypothetical protein
MPELIYIDILDTSDRVTIEVNPIIEDVELIYELPEQVNIEVNPTEVTILISKVTLENIVSSNWGDIGGNIENQLDLIERFNLIAADLLLLLAPLVHTHSINDVIGLSDALQRLSDAISLKLNKVTTSTGTIITFTTPTIYNEFDSPASTNFSNNLTGAEKGIIQKIYHQNNSEPTYPAGWVKKSGEYVINQLNTYYCEWSKGSRVEYWITQDE